jgi:hypothetical protein
VSARDFDRGSGPNGLTVRILEPSSTIGTIALILSVPRRGRRNPPLRSRYAQRRAREDRAEHRVAVLQGRAELRAEGKTIAELAREYECGEATIWRVLHGR